MEKSEIANLRPSLFMDPELGTDVLLSANESVLRTYGKRQEFVKFFDPHAYEEGGLDYQLLRFNNAAYYVSSWLKSLSKPSNQLRVLEIGCGAGIIALGLCDSVKQIVGIDVDARIISKAEEIHAAAKTNNVQFHVMNGEDALTNIGMLGFDTAPDLIVFGGSIEHHTIRERMSLFPLMAEMLEAGSAMVVFDTPNRLIPYDSHSSELHFTQSLPEYLAAAYSQKSPRADVRAHLNQGYGPNDPRWLDPDAHESIYRLGRSISYHEFEVHLAELGDLQYVADGWDPIMLNRQLVSRSELELETYFRFNELPVHRAFSRHWLDFVMRKPIGDLRPPRRVSLKEPQADARVQRYERKLWWSLDIFSTSHKMVFDVSGNVRSSAVVLIHGTDHKQEFEILIDDQSVAVYDTDTLKAAKPPSWHRNHAIPVTIPDGSSEITLVSNSNNVVVCEGLLI